MASSFRPPRRGIIAASTTSAASTIYSKPTTITSSILFAPPPPHGPNLLTLIRCIANSIDNLSQCYDFTNSPSNHLSSCDRETTEFIGRGKTFSVSRLPLPAHIAFEGNFWPKRLALCEELVLVEGPRGFINKAITCKRPLIELNALGNPVDGADEEALEAVILEVRVLTHPPLYLHRNIVDFLGVSWQRDSGWFVPGAEEIDDARLVPGILMEYARHGSLEDFRKTEEYEFLSFNDRVKLCRDVAEGLRALHGCGVVHGDVKLGNILIFDDIEGGVTAKLADFGFSVKGNSKTHGGADGMGWRLKGRTWPWNDPEWDQQRDWEQLVKTDVFSYGLLVWTILSGEELETLFDLGPDMWNCRNDSKTKDMVEGMKDWTLSFNAAEYFKKSDEEVKLLAQCLFHCALDARVESRGLMEDITKIWDTWFINSPPYRPYPPDITPPDASPIENTDSVRFEIIVAYMSDSPPSVKHQFNNICLDQDASIDERCDATLFRGLSHLIGWGAPKDFEVAKQLIGEATDISLNVAVFQTMFFSGKREHLCPKGCCTYKRGVLNALLAVIRSVGGHEALQQLIRYFPMVLDVTYRSLRSTVFRRRRYSIGIHDYPASYKNEGSAELKAEQWGDIERNFKRIPIDLGHNVLHYAVISGFTEVIEEVLTAQNFDDALIHQRDKHGDTPLMIAFRLGSLRIAELLIGAGSDVRTVNYYGESLLHFLDEFHDPEEMSEIADLILALGAKDKVNKWCLNRSLPTESVTGMPPTWGSPIVAPMLRNNIPLVKVLLKHGANPLLGDEWSPISYAALGHFVDILELFWEVCPTIPEKKVSKLLMAAIKGSTGSLQIYFHGVHQAKQAMKRTIDFLLNKLGGSTFLFGSVPLLDIAIQEGSADALAHVLSRIGGGDINRFGQSGFTPLHKAMLGDSVEKLKLLVEYGGDLTLLVKRDPPTSSLRFACYDWGGNAEVVQYLLDHGLGRDSLGDWGRTIIHCVGHCNFKVAQMIINAGADIDTLDEKGWTILGLSARTCTPSSIDQLRFLIDHQTAIGKKPAGFIAVPGEGKTVLHLAAIIPATSPFYDRASMADVLDYLLDRFHTPEQLNATDYDGYTALHYAARAGNSIFIQRLLDFRALDPNIICHSGLTAFQHTTCQLIQGPPKGTMELGGKRAMERWKKDMLNSTNMLAGTIAKGVYFHGFQDRKDEDGKRTMIMTIEPDYEALQMGMIDHAEKDWIEENGEEKRKWKGKEKEVLEHEENVEEKKRWKGKEKEILEYEKYGEGMGERKWKGKEKEKLDVDVLRISL